MTSVRVFRVIRGSFFSCRLCPQQCPSSVDMLFFQAEQDDYHLARISELIKSFRLSNDPAHT